MPDKILKFCKLYDVQFVAEFVEEKNSYKLTINGNNIDYSVYVLQHEYANMIMNENDPFFIDAFLYNASNIILKGEK